MRIAAAASSQRLVASDSLYREALGWRSATFLASSALASALFGSAIMAFWLVAMRASNRDQSEVSARANAPAFVPKRTMPSRNKVLGLDNPESIAILVAPLQREPARPSHREALCSVNHWAGGQ